MQQGIVIAPVHTMPVFNDLTRTTRFMVQMIRRSGIKYDAIAGCGNSGLLLTGSLCSLLYKYPIAVRKDNERASYSSSAACGALQAMRYIIVDDLVSTGWTMQHIIDKIHEAADRAKVRRPKPVAIFLFNSYESTGHRALKFRVGDAHVMLPVFGPTHAQLLKMQRRSE